MSETTFAVIALLVLGWAVVSSLLARANLTGALLFTAAGYLLANPDWGPLSVDVDAPSIHHVAEVTLALLLFSDAARVDVVRLRADVGVPVRLLGLGLPLTLVLGAVSRRGASTTCRWRWSASWPRRWRRPTPRSARR